MYYSLALKFCASVLMLYRDVRHMHIYLIELMLFAAMNAFALIYDYIYAECHVSMVAIIIYCAYILSLYILCSLNIADVVALIIIAYDVCVDYTTMLLYINLMSLIAMITYIIYVAMLKIHKMPMMMAILIPYYLVLCKKYVIF